MNPQQKNKAYQLAHSLDRKDGYLARVLLAHVALGNNRIQISKIVSKTGRVSIKETTKN